MPVTTYNSGTIASAYHVSSASSALSFEVPNLRRTDMRVTLGDVQYRVMEFDSIYQYASVYQSTNPMFILVPIIDRPEAALLLSGGSIGRMSLSQAVHNNGGLRVTLPVMNGAPADRSGQYREAMRQIMSSHLYSRNENTMRSNPWMREQQITP